MKFRNKKASRHINSVCFFFTVIFKFTFYIITFYDNNILFIVFPFYYDSLAVKNSHAARLTGCTLISMIFA